MSASSHAFDRLDQAQIILEEAAERRRHGDPVAIEDLIAHHPDLEGELRQLAAACREVGDGFLEQAERAKKSRLEFDRLLSAVASPQTFAERYSIECEVGKGGMGAVYRIVDKKLSRPLAMKVILGQAEAPRSGNTPAVSPRQLARFLNEARITSQLDHPGIVPVHEVGVDEQGRAYFTMKLVQGRTLGDVFELHAKRDPDWSTPRVLGVIQRVCEALAFAHERGVIHRDLKPANVMVGDFGEVYVMDWGLARRLDHEDERAHESDEVDEELAQQVSLTREGRVLGTPCYMSPEQARGEIATMGPPSDVYAIGAMIYQLVAGAPPYTRQGERVSSEEILTRIEAGPPERLESRESAPELLAVIEKAMNYDRTLRYASVPELASDLERFVSGRTVRAFRTGAWVELEKWVRRNRALSSALGGVVLAIVGGAIAFAVKAEEERAQRLRADEQTAQAVSNADQLRVSEEEAKRQAVAASLARSEAEASAQEAKRNEDVARAREEEAQASSRRATRVTEFVQKALTGSDPNQGGARQLSVYEAMKRAVLELDRGDLRDDPQTEAALQLTISGILNGNAESGEALRLAEQAFKTRETLFASDHPDVAQSLSVVAACLLAVGRSDDALPKLEAALAMQERLHAGDHRDVAASLNDVAACLQSLGRNVEALSKLEAALAMMERLFAGDHPDVASGLNNVASCLHALGRIDEALPKFEAALAMRERLFRGDHPDVAGSLNNVAYCLLYLGKSAEARTKVEAALAMRERLFTGDHPDVAASLNILGNCLQALGDEAGALPRLEASLAMRERLFSGDHSEIALGLEEVAFCLDHLGRSAEALPKFEAALAMRERLFPGDHPDVAMSLNRVGYCLDSLGRGAEAVPKYEAALAMQERLFGSDHPDVAASLLGFSHCLMGLGRNAEALPKLEFALSILKGLFPGDHPAVASTLHNLGVCLDSLGRSADALPMLEDSLAMRERIFPGDHVDLAYSLFSLAYCLDSLERPADALNFAERASEMAARILPPNDLLRKRAAATLEKIRKRASQAPAVRSLGAH